MPQHQVFGEPEFARRPYWARGSQVVLLAAAGELAQGGRATTLFEWVGALAGIASVVALVLGLLAFLTERRERARAEVRLVYAVLDPDVKVRPPLGEEAPPSGRTATMDPKITIANDSAEMIYDIKFIVVGESRTRIAGRLLQPGKRMTRGLEKIDIRGVITTKTGTELTFTDGRGKRWHRDEHGRLRRIRPLRWWAPWRIGPASEWSAGGEPWYAILRQIAKRRRQRECESVAPIMHLFKGVPFVNDSDGT